MANLVEFLFGSGDKLKKVKQFTPEQMQMLKSITDALMDQGGGFQGAFNVLNQYLNPESDVYKSLEAPYLRQFEQETVPMLAERFAGFGGGMGGGLSSSGFGQALGAAGAGLQENLAAMKTGLQRQSAGDIFGLMQQALGAQPFGYERVQGGPGYIPTMVGQGMKGFGGGF